MAAVDDARAKTLALLSTRATDATLCPSEVARALVPTTDASGAPDRWRDMMPAVHLAVDRLVTEGFVRLSWKGKMLPVRAGPYRIGRVRRR